MSDPDAVTDFALEDYARSIIEPGTETRSDKEVVDVSLNWF